MTPSFPNHTTSNGSHPGISALTEQQRKANHCKREEIHQQLPLYLRVFEFDNRKQNQTWKRETSQQGKDTEMLGLSASRTDSACFPCAFPTGMPLVSPFVVITNDEVKKKL